MTYSKLQCNDATISIDPCSAATKRKVKFLQKKVCPNESTITRTERYVVGETEGRKTG